MFSDRSALDILNEHKTELDKENDYHIPVMATTKFSTGIKLVLHVLYILFHCWDFYGLKLYQEKNFACAIGTDRQKLHTETWNCYIKDTFIQLKTLFIIYRYAYW